MKTKENFRFTCTGFVLGNLWGGGNGGYPARPLSANTKEELIKQAEEGLDGSLDSGMGFESLLGALLFITTTTTIKHNGKEFENQETEDIFIGELTEEQQDFLIECSMNY
jgi:hypothetical protein